VSLRGVIARLNPATYSVQRRGAGTYDDTGHHTAGALSSFSIVADVQPYDGKELQDEPAGQRAEDKRLVITTTELRGVTPAAEDASEYGAAGSAPDRILIDAEWYVIKNVETWRSFGSVHYECIAVRASRSA
jgi:hypothetical protein